MHVGMKCIQNFSNKTQRRDSLSNLGVDGRLMINDYLKKSFENAD
jgi:hypothetical protein